MYVLNMANSTVHEGSTIYYYRFLLLSSYLSHSPGPREREVKELVLGLYAGVWAGAQTKVWQMLLGHQGPP